MKVYAVIDTNVIVSALLSPLSDSATVIIRDKIEDGTIVPLYNEEILNEYKLVLSRPKFGFPECLIVELLETIRHQGLSMERTKTEEVFVDVLLDGEMQYRPAYKRRILFVQFLHQAHEFLPDWRLAFDFAQVIGFRKL